MKQVLSRNQWMQFKGNFERPSPLRKRTRCASTEGGTSGVQMSKKRTACEKGYVCIIIFCFRKTSMGSMVYKGTCGL